MDYRTYHIRTDTLALMRRAAQALRRTGLRIALPLALGFALARTGVPGGIYPFGAAFAAAVPSGSVTAAMAGVLLGFVLPGSDAETLRCAASAVAVAGIKWALSELRPIRNSPLFPPASALAGVVLTGAVVSSAVGAAVGYDLALYFAEGALAAACTYFFCGALEGWRHRNTRALTAQEIYCTAASLCVVCIPLCRISILGFSPFTAAAAIIVLACGRRLGAAGGASAGIALGAALALADSRFSALGVCAAAGLTASLFQPLGDIALSVVFAVTCALCSVLSGSLDIYFIAEAVLASVAFPIIGSERLGFVFDALDTDKYLRPVSRSEGYIVGRLTDAAKGLEEASRTMREVSDRLDRLEAPLPASVCRRATGEVCADCAISRFCWETSREETQRLFDSLSTILRKDGRLTRRNTPDLLRSRCARWGEMSERINAAYAEYAADEQARRRVTQVRRAVMGQMQGCGRLLGELAQDSSSEERAGQQLSEQAAKALEEYGVEAEDVCCLSRRDGSLTLTLTLTRNDEFPEPEEDVRVILSEELQTALELTSVREEGERITARLDSIPAYTLEVDIVQHSRGGGALCGDACEVMEDRPGERVVLLSDGMGTGSRAAVDSAMTCSLMRRLLSAGFSEGSAVELVNSAMQISSETESLATLDCARFDLYNGRLTLSKAGAAASYLLRNGKAEELTVESLPLGIMEQADWNSVGVDLQPGDIILMVSDGAAGQDDSWLADRLEESAQDGTRRLARDILALALARCGQDDDDITVAVMRIDQRDYEAEEQAA